jgi:hypothetical protein
MTMANLSDRILERLGEVRARCPELRFGQLLATIGELTADETGLSIWDVEDADFAAAVDRFATDLARRAERSEPPSGPECGGVPPSGGPPPSQRSRQGS